jgi:hypothetical protein
MLIPPAVQAAYDKLQLENPSNKLDPLKFPLECREFIRRDCGIGRWEILYILPNAYRLSIVSYEKSLTDTALWEICVFDEKGDDAGNTPLGRDAQIFMTDENACEFINRAIKLASWKK